MNMLFWIAALATGLLMPAAKAKAVYEVMTRNDIFFAEHDGVKLLGDFYAPKGLLASERHRRHRLRAKNASKAAFASGECRRSLKILAS